jgi:surface antigen
VDFRKRRANGLFLVATVAVGLSIGCQTMQKSTMGAAIGGVFGGLAGTRVGDGGAEEVLIGTAVGAGVGYLIGRHMDERDIERRNAALEHNDVGQTTTWRSDEGDAEHRVTPVTAARQTPQGKCRSFKQEVFVDGRRETIDATACKRDESQGWELVGAEEPAISPGA